MEPQTQPIHSPGRKLPPEARLTASVWLATGLGVGLITPAPGTFGALWGLLLAWAIGQAPELWMQALLIAPLLAIGVPLCQRAAEDLGGFKDPGAIVWDELSTVPIVFCLQPIAGWRVALLGFALHRLFDVTKPWPCRRLERLPGGLGIMCDDVAAAVYAAVALWLLSAYV